MRNTVLYAPNFCYNLLLVSQLTKELGILVIFRHIMVILEDYSSGKLRDTKTRLVAKGYTLLTQPLLASILHMHIRERVTISSPTDIGLWDHHLSHVSLNKMKDLFFFETRFDLIVTDCLVCPLAKQIRLPFSLCTTRTKAIYDLVHLDVWGPHRVPTIHSHRYFLTIVDDYSRSTWIYKCYSIRAKSSTILAILSLIHAQFNRV